MKLTVERLPASLVRLEIGAEDAEFDSAYQRAAKRVAREVMVPGFRKGKAPAALVQKMYGREVFLEEANRLLMDDLYRKALEQEDLAPVGDPEAEVLEQEPFLFAVTVPVYPTVELGDYQSVRIESADAAIEDSLIDETIERVRVAQSPWVDPAKNRSPKEGDQVVVDIAVMVGENELQEPSLDNTIVLGEANLLTELVDLIQSLKVGESGSVDIAFGDEDSRLAEEDNRRGETVTYNVTLKTVKERDLLPLDDEFAKTYGNAESLDELRDRVKENLHSERTREARSEVVARMINAIADTSPVEVPDAMVDEAVDERVNRLRQQMSMNRGSLEGYLRSLGQTEAEFREDIRPAVAQDVRNSIVLRAVAEAEGIEIDDAEIEAEILGLSTTIENDDSLRESYLSNAYLRNAVRNDLYDRALTDRLIEITTEGQGAVLNAWTPTTVDEAETGEKPAAKVKKKAPLKKSAAKSESTEPQAAIDGACPTEYPVKGNADSMIYHLPGGSSYDATIPEYCFADSEAAEAAGYRAAGSS